ncbi:Ribonuclease H-like protein, partial [Macrophomina phaseolina MS6]
MLAQSPTSISSWVKDTFESRREVVKSLLHNAKSKINISTDIWSSTNKRSYAAICAHFVDQVGKLRVLLIGLPRILGEHTDANIAYCLVKVFRIYQIEDLIGSFIADNATNNDTLLQAIARDLPYLDGNKDRLRCVGHIINLVVKALLFGKGLSKLEKDLLGADDKETFLRWRRVGPIGKIHNLCVWVNRSDQRRQKFLAGQIDSAELDEDFDEDGDPEFYYQLLVDGGVRWNSVYYMIKRALRLRTVIDLFFLRYRYNKNDEEDMSKDALSNDDWHQLELFYALLKPFKDLTKHMEGNANKGGREGSHGALWETLKTMDF